MAMRTIHFEQLSSHHCALMDARSISLLGTPGTYAQLSTPLRKLDKMKAAYFRTAFLKQLRDELDVLARLVTYDFVVIDAHNASRLQGTGGGFDDFVVMTDPGIDWYRLVDLQVTAKMQVLGRTSMPARWNAEHFDGAEKSYQDELFRSPGTVSVANSDQSLPQTLFYLELARLARRSIFLSPGKRDLLQALSAELIRPDVLQVIQERLSGPLQTVVSSSFATSTDSFSIPPLPQYIYAMARLEGISLLEVVHRIRATDGARAFRQWCASLESKRLQGGVPGDLEAIRILAELDRACKKWTEELDLQAGVKYEVRTANLTSLPLPKVFADFVKSFVEFSGVALKARYKDPIIWGTPSWLTFVSSWYGTMKPDSD